jgi:hypothetical protein
MAALALQRDTPCRLHRYQMVWPVLTNVKIFRGALLITDATGEFARPGVTATACVAIGRAEEDVDSTGITSGLLKVKITAGIFGYANLGGDLVVGASKMKLCYVTDDQTVGITATGKSPAGAVYDLDANYVFVDINPLARV